MYVLLAIHIAVETIRVIAIAIEITTIIYVFVTVLIVMFGVCDD